MHSQIWVVSTLLISIVLIVLTIVKFKFHPFLALLLASFFVGTMMGMGPLDMVNAGSIRGRRKNWSDTSTLPLAFS